MKLFSFLALALLSTPAIGADLGGNANEDRLPSLLGVMDCGLNNHDSHCVREPWPTGPQDYELQWSQVVFGAQASILTPVTGQRAEGKFLSPGRTGYA